MILLLASIVATWVGFAAVFVGIGLLVRRLLLRVATTCADQWLAAFWLGFCGVLAVLQIFHLVHKIDVLALVVVVAFGAWGGWLGRRDLRGLVAPGWPTRVVTLALVVAGAFWLADQVLVGPGNYDTGLYHIQAMRWNLACPIVPGLGNLH